MKLARCTNCHQKWKVKEIVAIGFSKDGKDCSDCGEKQYISAGTQRLFTLGFWSLLIVPLLLFSIKLSDKDEPLY